VANALIGESGFVGTTLQKQTGFDALFRSTNINSIRGSSYDLVVCAAAPAQKWIANKKPDADRQNINALIENLKTIRAKKFVLISTVDVFSDPEGVDEDTQVGFAGLHAYGSNRRRLEQAVTEHFSSSLVIRLPGLVGPGLRKNAIFDFPNDNNVATIPEDALFQFYPMVNLWRDIEIGIQNKLALVI